MQAAFFPHLHPAETVYSVCARFHFASRSESPEQTANLLFGTASARLYSDVPCCLDHLQMATAGAIQASEHTIRTHTGLNAYMVLMPPASRIAFVQACRKGQPAGARARSGLNRYVGPQSVLKLCKVCVESQLSMEGVARWSAVHQRPGVWFCDQHQAVLSFTEAPGLERNRWALPHQLLSSTVQPILSVQAQLKILRLAAVVQWISANHHLETAVLQVMLKERLRNAGLCASELKCRIGERELLEKQMHDYCDDVPLPELQRLNASEWLRLLLSSDSRHYDPLTWSVAISWHGDVSNADLVKEYFNARSRKPERDLFDSLPHRERRVSAPNRIYRALETSNLKKDAFKNSRITQYEIDSWLRRDPGLKTAWQRAVRLRAKTESVIEIKTFLALHPSALRVDILRACNRAYRWLDAHDPDQLQRLLPWVMSRHSRQLRLPWGNEASISSDRIADVSRLKTEDAA
jgi:hypothetical protein